MILNKDHKRVFLIAICSKEVVNDGFVDEHS